MFVFLFFLVRPSAPSNLRFLEVNATALQLTWVEGSKGRSPITKYVIEGNNETGFANDETSQWFDALIVNDPYKIYNLPPVIIENLRPATVYRFRVKAFNKVGPSPASPKSMDITTADARKYKVASEFTVQRKPEASPQGQPGDPDLSTSPQEHITRKRAITIDNLKHSFCFELSVVMVLFRVICWVLVFILRLRFPPGSSKDKNQGLAKNS